MIFLESVGPAHEKKTLGWASVIKGLIDLLRYYIATK